MVKFKCAIFDLDGTLLDTSEGVISSVRYTVEKYGLKMLDDETIKSFIGPPIQKSFYRIYGFSDNVIKEMSATFREHYKNVDLLRARPYEGIYDTLEELKENGINVAIATYKRQDYAWRIMDHFGFNKYTTNIWGSDFEGKLKKEDIIHLALQHAEIKTSSDAVVIGDSDNDAIGAREIGASFLGVTYGFGFKFSEEIKMYGSIGVANAPEEIAGIILGGRI